MSDDDLLKGLADPFWIWVIYDHPRDYPDFFVARAQRVLPDGSTEQSAGFASYDVEDLRAYMISKGLTRVPRFAQDDPVILETWL